MLLTFFDQKLQFTYIQATEKAYPALLKIKFNTFFLCLRVIFALLDPDLDCKSGSESTAVHVSVLNFIKI